MTRKQEASPLVPGCPRRDRASWYPAVLAALEAGGAAPATFEREIAVVGLRA